MSAANRRFWAIVLVTLILTRIWVVLWLEWILPWAQPAWREQILKDAWHHYYIGIVLILTSGWLRSRRSWHWVLPVGIGILVEEWTVVIMTLTPFRMGYPSLLDFLGALGLVGLFALLHEVLRSRRP